MLLYSTTRHQRTTFAWFFRFSRAFGKPFSSWINSVRGLYDENRAAEAKSELAEIYVIGAVIFSVFFVRVVDVSKTNLAD